MRRSSADLIDGRARLATGRNSRLNIALKPEYLNAFKEGCDDDGASFCEKIEEIIEEKWPKLVTKYRLARETI